ncbi:MAG: DUF2024 family protein [Chitinophaga sp.]|uniref:DUF2024 family protein n=1 Tax=Chitinophaga sp. TaxID=1869181 RepID=UPI001B01BCDE|nr:DUF2024 family protein [Chitinophaga sp.]MBO9729046.1 DUF2024 family protein [Chitinophaga sp.]
MEVAVYDTYVKRKDGSHLHFNIIVNKDTRFEEVLVFGKKYLQGRRGEELFILRKDCRFSHITEVIPRWEVQILRKGYYIYELEGCRGKKRDLNKECH